jgi:hypothetical protein
MVAQIHRRNVDIVKSKCSRLQRTRPSGTGLAITPAQSGADDRLMNAAAVAWVYSSAFGLRIDVGEHLMYR